VSHGRAERISREGFNTLVDFVPGVITSVKLEGLNPAGSIKAKAAEQMVLEAELEGRLSPGSRLIESSSGNLGVALASLCAARGYHLTIVVDPNTNARTARKAHAFGAEVVMVHERDTAGGFLQSRIDHIRRALRDDPDLVWLNQYVNPANPAAHQHMTMREIVDAFGEPDWLFVGVGTAGTLMGCLAGIRDLGLSTRVVAVEPTGSVIFGGPPGSRHIPGIGASRPSELFRRSAPFLEMTIDEVDAVRTCREVARRHGLLLGGSSGSVLAAVRQMRPRLNPGERVLAISPDMGDAYLETIYDDAWVAARFGDDALRPCADPGLHPALDGAAHA
jgi:cysteine synthase A